MVFTRATTSALLKSSLILYVPGSVIVVVVCPMVVVIDVCPTREGVRKQTTSAADMKFTFLALCQSGREKIVGEISSHHKQSALLAGRPVPHSMALLAF